MRSRVEFFPFDIQHCHMKFGVVGRTMASRYVMPSRSVTRCAKFLDNVSANVSDVAVDVGLSRPLSRRNTE